MKRYAILAMAAFWLAMPTGAQVSSKGQSDAPVQAQTNASASGSPQSQSPPANNGDSAPSKSASGPVSSGASATANAGANSLSIADGTPILATLITTLDAKKNKPGDPVAARTTQDVKQGGQVVLKRGSRVTGHLTQAAPRSGGDVRSSLGIVFDNAVTKNGQQMPLHLSVRALAAETNQASASSADDMGTFGSGVAAAPSGAAAADSLARGVAGSMGGMTNTATGVAGNTGQAVNGTAGAATQTAASASGSVGSMKGGGQLTSGSSGVFGLQGLNLTSAASNGTQASVVNSTSRNVHLDSGTQMVLQVLGQ
jgi:hypothetical protein